MPLSSKSPPMRPPSRASPNGCSGSHPGPESISDLKLPAEATVRDLYAALVETDLFRAACGRISASYAW